MFWKFGDFMNLDPDWTNFVDPDPDPDTINPDPHHWVKVYKYYFRLILSAYPCIMVPSELHYSKIDMRYSPPYHAL